MAMTRRKKIKLTHETILNIVEYNKNLGTLTWKKPTGNRAKVGMRVGNICRFHGNEYLQARIQKENFLIHRLIWFIEKGEWPKHQIDHIDGNGLNNKIQNLRDVPVSEQSKNLSRRETNTSGVTGVTWNKNIRKWVAQISVNNEAKYLGKFDLFEDAVKIRKEAEKKYGFHANHDRPK